MAILNIDVSNPDLLKKPVYEPISPGIYVLEVANDLKIEDSKSSDNKVVNIELRVLDDEEYKGRVIFDSLVLSNDPDTKRKTEWKIAQFAVATGLCTTETLSDGVDLEAAKGCTCKARVGTKTHIYEGETRVKNTIKEYMFE